MESHNPTLVLKFGKEVRVLRRNDLMIWTWFARASRSGVFKEATASTIRLHGDKPAALHATIDFALGHSYQKIREARSNGNGLLFDVWVYIAADKYECSALMSEVLNSISPRQALPDIRVSSIGTKRMLALPNPYRERTNAREECLYDAVNIAYELEGCDGRLLRTALLSRFAASMPLLLQEEALQKLMRKYFNLCRDIMTMDTPTSSCQGVHMKCGDCSSIYIHLSDGWHMPCCSKCNSGEQEYVGKVVTYTVSYPSQEELWELANEEIEAGIDVVNKRDSEKEVDVDFFEQALQWMWA